MKRLFVLQLILLLFQLNYATTKIEKDKMEQKRGILLVTFGTSYSEASIAFDNIEEEVKAAFPDIEVRWAYTSKIIRNILHKRGIDIDSPAEALAKMGDNGFTHVAVQSLHVIPGEEFNNLKRTVELFNQIPKGIQVAILGAPLLYLDDDNHKMATFIDQTFRNITDTNSILLLMGHGTNHPANIYYPGFQYYLNQKSQNYWLATVEGYPSLKHLIPLIKQKGIKKVTLTPFMSVAGDHAKNDMAAKEEDSWKSVLEKEGFEVEIILKGLAEYDQVVSIWVEHLKVAFDRL